jgi:hypothetical protein
MTDGPGVGGIVGCDDGGIVGVPVGKNEGFIVGCGDGTGVGCGVGLSVGLFEVVGIGEGTASNLLLTMQKVVLTVSSVPGRLVPPLTDGEFSLKSEIPKAVMKVGLLLVPVKLNK